MLRRDVLREIERCEAAGEFDRHVDPIPREITLPVDGNYRYVGSRTFLEGLKYRLEKIFGVWPVIWYENRFVLKTQVIGRENLKGLDAAVLICNHVDKFDCLAAKYAARGHRTYVVAADFNNMKGTLGELMRAGDMLPLNTEMRGRIHFSRAVERVLRDKKQFLLVYPEAAMWWHYRKPRPYKDGAFSFAVKYGVPVVPQFITFRDSGKKDAEGLPVEHFTLHIDRPIYPRADLSRRDNIAYLRDAAFAACRRIYEETYGEPLCYGDPTTREEQHG